MERRSSLGHSGSLGKSEYRKEFLRFVFDNRCVVFQNLPPQRYEGDGAENFTR